MDLEARSDGGGTPLHYAAHHGHLPVVQYLCEQGADKEARDNDDMTPLNRAEISWATAQNRSAVINYLKETVSK